MIGQPEVIDEIARRFLHHIAETGEADIGLCTSDAVWWTMLGGEVPVVDQVTRMKAAALRSYSGPGRMEIDRVIVGNEVVVIEARGFQPLKNGKSYDNFYAWIISFRGGLISRVNHYFNPETAKAAMSS